MDNNFNILTIIFTSTLVSGVVSIIATGIIERKRFIFEKKLEAFTVIINTISNAIKNIPNPKDEFYYTQISENFYIDFKYNIDKYILYLKNKNLKLIENILKLFSKNIYIEPVISFDPNEIQYIPFDRDDRNEIIKYKDLLIHNFQKELGIKYFFQK